MDIILVFSDGFLFLHEFRFEILFEVIVGSCCGLHGLGLYLTMYDLIDGYVGIDIFILLALLLLVELVSLCDFAWFFVTVGVMFWIML